MTPPEQAEPRRSAADGSEVRTRKGLLTAERILDVAEEVFAEKGFEGATLRDVAERVGIRIPSLYNHFESKESLYVAVLDRGIGPVLTALADAASGTAPDPLQLVDRMMELLSQRPNIPRLVLHETLAGGRHLTTILRERVGLALARGQQMVETGPAASRWDAEQLPNLLLAMYHIVVGYFAMAPLYRELNDVDLLSPEALERQRRFLQKLVMTLFADELPAEPDAKSPN